MRDLVERAPDTTRVESLRELSEYRTSEYLQASLDADKLKENLKLMQKELMDLYRKVHRQADENREMQRLQIEEPKNEGGQLKKSTQQVSKLELALF
jgi:hypothetical protein